MFTIMQDPRHARVNVIAIRQKHSIDRIIHMNIMLCQDRSRRSCKLGSITNDVMCSGVCGAGSSTFCHIVS
ncbi:hypothetical protein D3C80_2081920 [compost metagenome]